MLYELMTSFAQAGQVTQLIRLDVVIILSLFVPKHPKRDDMMNLSSVSLFVFGSAPVDCVALIALAITNATKEN